MSKKFQSGFVSIIGRPNAGKSTLLNALVGQKVAIVADKPQTTRTSIQGVVTLPEAQIVFIDTPGIHRADTPLNKRLMDTVRTSLEERDLLLFVADATRAFEEQDRRAVDMARRTETPVLLVLNKVDLIKEKARLLPQIEAYKSVFEFADYLPVSASKGQGLDELREAIVSRLPEGPAYFPEDHVTDQPERFLAAELIREKVILRMFVALVAVLFAASVCLAADKPVSDDAISDYVRLKLASDPDVKGGALQVDVKSGVVTLGGTVENQRLKDKATKLAKKV